MKAEMFPECRDILLPAKRHQAIVSERQKWELRRAISASPVTNFLIHI
ncbi:hypothetical protein FP2506_14549 [Fulvimarina pelagi HTCC2506]|uniref:Uncharacterized protein n=1 Tax=Fulvimarina pelagi HTCC2506 TaxID=314231 RepID=Q0G420_9HYPH|nr:hypothetical protein FP2506_14549 [Fulvimarina pelagi HTCC2506]